MHLAKKISLVHFGCLRREFRGRKADFGSTREDSVGQGEISGQKMPLVVQEKIRQLKTGFE